MILPAPHLQSKAISDDASIVETALRRICQTGGYASAHRVAERSMKRVWTSATPEQRTGWMG